MTPPLKNAVLALVMTVSALTSTSVVAAPVTDPNLGTWVDPYDDSAGIAPVAATFGTTAIVGQNAIVRDPQGRFVTMAPVNPALPGHWWFTSEVAPASFSSWGSLYLDLTSSAANQVQVEVWNTTAGNASATRLLGPVSPVASDDPAYTGRVSLASIPTSAGRLRFRIILADQGAAIKPTVSALKATFVPTSVINAGLEAPAARNAGDAIQLRMPVSVSFVNATSYVAFLTVGNVSDDRYTQTPQLGFESATLGGLWHPGPGPLVVQGVTVPARSVYWSAAVQNAGTTYAYYATFRAPNGLVRGLGFNFVGNVYASNSQSTPNPIATPTRLTRIESAPNTGLQKNASGTFVIGGEHYAARTANITLTVSPHNWWNQGIPFGAQNYFSPIVWDSFQDFITKGVIANGNAVTIPAGAGKTGTVAETHNGVLVPANSVYWDLNDLSLGQRLDLSYQIQLAAPANMPNDTVVNACSTAQAVLATAQESVAGVNACSGTACAPRTACLPIKIGVNEGAVWGFAKGDQVNGSAAIRVNYDDNPGRFITWGQPITYKLFVSNGGVSSLDNVVVYDRVPVDTTFVSASIPASVGKVWYYTAASPTQPELYVANTTTIAANWSSARPATVEWVAFEITRIRSSYCTGAAPTINCAGTEPTAVTMDFTVQTPAAGASACAEKPARATCIANEPCTTNLATAKVYRYTPLNNVTVAVPGGPATVSDWEDVAIRPLVPDLSTSYATGTGSVEPGQTATHTVYVQNRSNLGNPLDTATNIVTTIDIPKVVANGVERYLDLVLVNSGGGTITYDLPARVTVTWPTILPNQTRAVELRYQLPLGIRNNSTFSTVADVVADDDCVPVRARPTYQTSIASSPVFALNKDVDYRVVGSNIPVTYSLTYRNNGTAPSTQTWVIDRLADVLTLTRVKAPVGSPVWFSDKVPPFFPNNPTTGGLPPALTPDFQFSDAVVRAHFTPGPAPDANGWVTAPAGARWVAILADDQTLNPPLFPSGQPQTAFIEVMVTGTNLAGQLVTNEGAIVSAELFQSISPRVSFLLSDEPGLDLAKTCDEVASVGEEIVYTIHFRNDTTNPDDAVVISDTLPAQLIVDPADIAFMPAPTSTVVATVNGRTRYTWTFPPLGSLDEGTITIAGTVRNGIQSGTFITNEVIGTATNEFGEASIYDDCTTLVENADLFMRKLVDNPQPRSGDEVTYTLTVSNENRKTATDVTVVDILPAGMTYVAPSARVLTPGYTLASAEPNDQAGLAVFRLKPTNLDAGVLPGPSGPVTLTFRARVLQTVNPGTTLTNRAEAFTETGEDTVFTNVAEVSVTTPLPDPYVTVSVPTLVKPGETTTFTLLYGNEDPEDGQNTVVFFAFPDGPVPNNQADFSLAGLIAPPGTGIYYSAAALGPTPTFSPANPTLPANGWTSVAGATVNHIAFVVSHCATAPCNPGDLDRLTGPFEIRIATTARAPGGALPFTGQPFTATASIAMIGNSFADADLTNNTATATVRTPGVDLEVQTVCSPSGVLPGLPPGETATFTVDLANTGTTPAYGIRFVAALDPSLEYLFDDSATLNLVDDRGESVYPIDESGRRVTMPVAWTRSGTTFTLGQTTNVNAADYYLKIGFAAGDAARVTISAKVGLQVADSTAFTSTATGTVIGRDGDDDEEYFDNNQAACGATVYRSDVFVIKTMTNATDPTKSYADGGDRVRVTVEYGNAGRFPASDVSMSDTLVDGLIYVANSQRNIPIGATLELDDGTGSWTAQAGPNVRSVRVRYDDAMPAPATGTFSQSSVAEFDEGTYDGTEASEELQAVVVAGGGEVDACATANECPKQTSECSYYGGAYVPEGACCQSCCPLRDFECESQFENDLSNWNNCQATGGNCGPEPVNTCSPPGCDGTCYGSLPTPSKCFGTGVYFPGGQCNQSCCPPADTTSLTYQRWREQCISRHNNAMEGWNNCMSSGGSGYGTDTPDCGPEPEFTCDGIPTACDFGGGVGNGSYTSPVLPRPDDGRVLSWGALSVDATFGGSPDEAMSIEVFSTDGDGEETVLASHDIDPDGDNAFDLTGIDPADHPNLQVRAFITGESGTCMKDIVPDDDNFWGFPTALNEAGLIVGIQEGNVTWFQGGEDRNMTAWAWSENGNGTAWRIHDVLPISAEAAYAGYYWTNSNPSDINDNSTIVGWASYDIFNTWAIDPSCEPDVNYSFGDPADYQIQPNIVWTPATPGTDGIPYTARCLPRPNSEVSNFETPRAMPDLPIEARTYINEAGLIAGTFNARRSYLRVGELSSFTKFGTPTVWCPVSDGYLARPIRVFEQENDLAPASVVTGLGEDGSVIGVSATPSANGYDYRAMLWRPVDASACPSSWHAIDLSDALSDALAISVASLGFVAPLQLDESGDTLRIVGSRNLQTRDLDFRTIVWTDVGDGFLAEQLLTPDDAPRTVLSTGFDFDGLYLRQAFGTSTSADNGHVALFSVPGDNSANAWFYDNNNYTQLDSGFGAFDITTGLVGDRVLGYGVIDGQFRGSAWTWDAGRFRNLGQLFPDGAHFPTLGNASGLVVGSASVNVNEESLARVFYWRACGGETPRLDGWSVSYQTDKNPSFSFEVELADICTTNISNTADITTSTPEITLSNNTSTANLSVNTADLALTMDVDQGVVAPGLFLDYEMVAVNDGPGIARDVTLTVTAPFGCIDLDVQVDTDLVVTNDAYDAATNTYTMLVAEMPLQSEVYLLATCQNAIEVAGTVLVGSFAAESPTIDCNAANNDPDVVSIVGNFPNLWVTIDGPTSVPVGTPATYTVDFGNNGNTPITGAIFVYLPTGATATLPTNSPHTINYSPASHTLSINPYGTGNNAAGSTGSATFDLVWSGCASAAQSAVVRADFQGQAPESDIADNQASASTLVTAPAGTFELVTEVAPVTVASGQEVLYTVHFANTGAQAIQSPTLSVALTNLSGVVAPGGTIAANTVTFTPGEIVSGSRTLRAGSRGAVVIRGTPTGIASGTVTASGTGACPATTSLPTATPNNDALQVVVAPSVGSQCDTDKTPVRWNLTVTNPSTTAKAGVTVPFTLPAGMTYVAGSINGPGANAVGAPTFGWTFDLPARGVVNLSVDAVIATPARFYTGRSNAATGTLVGDCSDRLTLSKNWSLGCGVDGQTFLVTLTATNNGKTVVRNATLADPIGEGVTPTVTAGWTLTNGTLSTTLPELAPGQTLVRTYDATVTAAAGQALVNRATLTASNAITVASNLVGGGIANCDDGVFCTVDTCTAFVGCQNTFTARPGVPETCNGTDDDCDTLLDAADEDLVSIACSLQSGACEDSMRPSRLCVAGAWSACDTAAYEAHNPRYDTVDTTCDGFDDDCLAGNDDDYVSLDTTCGVGACAATGDTSCVAGQVVDSCVTGTPTAERCNNADDDCDGLLDAQDLDLVLVPCTLQNGVCAGSMTTRNLCVAGTWQSCTPQIYGANAFPRTYQVVEDLCDAENNDCDAQTDENFQSRQTQCGVGECAGNAGMTQCSAGEVRDTCNPLAGAVAELCDAKDNDCDGDIDEDFTQLGTACDPTPGDGNACQNGVFQCAAGGGVSCVQTTASQVEICDNVDNDCNSQTDEGCDDDTDDFCDVTMGCLTGTVVTVCPNGCGDCNDANAALNPGRIEICNNLDDNCNGQTDEGCDDDGDDWCDAAMGCIAGATVCPNGCGDCQDTNAAINPGATETCNNVDDNCNTQVDEGFATGVECTNGEGLCERPGFTVCTSDGTGVICDAVPGEGAAETCDAVDNDCDGETDEDFVLGLECVVGLGECRQVGLRICREDRSSWRCSVAPLNPGLEICDAKDNDCDDRIDEDPLDPEGTVCANLDTTITSGPPLVTAATTASFTFIDPVTATNTRFECSLDGGAWVRCDGPIPSTGGGGVFTTGTLVAGSHTLLVRAIGPDGGVDPSPAVYTWLIDTTVPDTFIDAGPQNPAQTSTATFVFSASIPESEVATYFCTLDPDVVPPALPGLEDYDDCGRTITFAELDDGVHVLHVYVVNVAGTPDPTPAVYTWTIDTSLPDTVITTAPDSPTSSSSATFTYADPESPETLTFNCRIDGGTWVRCDGKTVSYDELPEGEHTFEVATIGPGGNIDPTPAIHIWVVDDTPPDTFIPVHPTDPSQNPTAIFGFGSDEDPVTYRCVIDPATTPPALVAYVACDATETFTGLSDGTHTIYVYATDVAGNVDPTPATYTWLIDTTFPETEITDGPPTLTSPTEGAAFDFIDPVTPTHTEFECRLDGGEWTRCDGGSTDYEADELTLGGHEFQVRACRYEPVVKCDPTPAIWTWEVSTATCPLDLEAPALTCAGTQTAECIGGVATLDPNNFLPVAVDPCGVELSVAYEGTTFPLGITPVVFGATDGNANTSTCATEVVVTDTTAPTATCAEDVRASTLPTACIAMVELGAPTIADSCFATEALVTYSDAPETFPVGVSTVTWTVVDPAGNLATCTHEVEVIDDVPLVITCPESLTQDAAADACAWTGTVPASATDNCAIDEAVIDQTKDWPVGETSVVFTAEDASGNTGTCTTALTVNDVTLPVAVCGVPTAAISGVPDIIRASATDACTAVATISTFSCATLDEAGAATPLDPADCPVSTSGADLTVDGRTLDGVLRITYTVTATDPSDNVGTIDCVLDYDPDRDADGVVNGEDNCADVPNADQTDTDDDGIGNACDNCPTTSNVDQVDADDDGVGDACDNCAETTNADQADTDGDGVGNTCDVCPTVSDAEQTDSDDNGIGDMCQDTDADGILDGTDNCLTTPNEDQEDTDDDGVGDLCDETPYDGLTASGDGACSSGTVGTTMLGLVLGLLALVLMRRRATYVR